MVLVGLSPDHLRRYMDAYIAISSDVSDWKDEHFLKDLPEKWQLSFAHWSQTGPLGYCVLSRRNGVVHINQFMVAQALRGQGIGSGMLLEATKRGAGSLKVSPANQGAIRFYQRHGFALQGRENGYLILAR